MAAAVASAQRQGSGTSVATLGQPPAAEPQTGSPAVAAGVGGDAPAEGLGLAVASVGMILLALTVLAVHELVGARAGPGRWRSALDSARATRRDLGERGEALPALVLVAVSLAVWSAIAFWILTR